MCITPRDLWSSNRDHGNRWSYGSDSKHRSYQHEWSTLACLEITSLYVAQVCVILTLPQQCEPRSAHLCWTVSSLGGAASNSIVVSCSTHHCHWNVAIACVHDMSDLVIVYSRWMGSWFLLLVWYSKWIRESILHEQVLMHPDFWVVVTLQYVQVVQMVSPYYKTVSLLVVLILYNSIVYDTICIVIVVVGYMTVCVLQTFLWHVVAATLAMTVRVFPDETPVHEWLQNNTWSISEIHDADEPNHKNIEAYDSDPQLQVKLGFGKY